MTNAKKTDCQWFEEQMARLNLQDKVVGSHVEAAASPHPFSIVYAPDKENKRFDVYLVGKKDGLFWEYVCWTEDEFQEEARIREVALGYIKAGFQGEGAVDENLQRYNPNLMFYAYPKEDHGDLYQAMRPATS